MQVTLELVSLNLPDSQDATVKKGTLLAHLQNAQGCHLDVVVQESDPAYATLLGAWQAYKPVVDKAIEDDVAWPVAPTYTLDLNF